MAEEGGKKRGGGFQWLHFGTGGSRVAMFFCVSTAASFAFFFGLICVLNI